MPWLSTRLRYGAVAQGFHWLTAFLVVIAYIVGPGGSEQRIYSPGLDVARRTHEMLGVSVLTITVLRLLWRLIDPIPEDPPMRVWMRRSAKTVHAVLYALLIATPVTAIVGAWMEGHPLTLWGFGKIGPMLPLAHDLGLSIAAVHKTLGDITVWVAGFHALAALFHHFFLRDRVLRSMLPGRWSAAASGFGRSATNVSDTSAGDAKHEDF